MSEQSNQFEFWKEQLSQSASELAAILANSEINPIEVQEAYDTLGIDLEHLQQFQTSKKTSYDYTDALPVVRQALRLQQRVERRLLVKAEPPVDNEILVPSAPVAPEPFRKIPELPITKFSGSFAAYASFRQSFLLKYAPLRISDAERLIHLQGNVTGPPADVIGKLPPEDKNYQVALNALDEKYHKPEKVVSEIHAEIEKIPQAQDLASSLSQTYYKLEGLLASLRSHGEDVDKNSLLRDRIYGKYPINIVYLVSDKKVLSITPFHQALSEYISMRTSINAVSQPQPQVKEEVKKITSALYGTVDNTPPPPNRNKKGNGGNRARNANSKVPKCIFCTNRHYSADCDSIVTLSARRAALRGKCELCLNPHHTKEQCPKEIICPLCKAKKEHARAICPTLFVNDKLRQMSTAPHASRSNVQTNSAQALFAHSHAGAHTSFVCSVINPATRRTYKIRAIMDNGCNHTYITEQAAKRLGLRILSYTKIPIGTFFHEDLVTSGESALVITNDKDFSLNLCVNTLPNVPQTQTIFDYNQFRSSFPEHADKKFVPQDNSMSVELILGADCFWHFLQPAQKITVASDTFLYETVFGWTLVGKSFSQSFSESGAFFAFRPKQALDKLCALDALGVSQPPLSAQLEEELALQSFYSNLKFVNNRYEIRWPWKEYPPKLANTYPLAIGRLRSLLTRLTDEQLRAYNDIIQSQLALGIIERVPTHLEKKTETFYLPHRAVCTPGKSTSLRIVYDGSAKPSKKDLSINDAIYKGSNILANLAAVFIRFRFFPVVLIADIEKAFLQLSVHELDRDYVRFVWVDPSTNKHCYVIYRFTRVPFGINASPFLLDAILDHHLQTHENEFTSCVRKSRYADNFCTGARDPETAIRLFREERSLFLRCSMNLRSWASNSAKVRDHIPSKIQVSSPVISVLGTNWEQQSDNLSIRKFTESPLPVTLRSMLASLGSFYDVCGLFTPLITKAKIVFQAAQMENNTWEDAVSASFAEEWVSIQSDFQTALNVTFPRFIADADDPENNFQIHAFVDASEKACAAVTYIRVVNPTRPTQVRLLYAKSRIVKPNLFTIPKLELIAAVLGARLIKFVQKSLDIKFSKQVLWSDSKATLSWITSTNLKGVFIRNRVDEIRAVPHIQFRYVPSETNPADAPSRGVSLETMLHSCWATGPQWLPDENFWPPLIYQFDDVSSNFDYLETEKKILFASPTVFLSPFELNASEFNDYLKLIRVTAISINAARKLASVRTVLSFSRPLRPMQCAELIWIRAEQNKHFSDVHFALKNKKSHLQITSWGLILDCDSIIRCTHRLRKANIPDSEKFPALLPRKSLFTALLIAYFHTLICHQGPAATLHALRREFWIPQGRLAVSNVVKKCVKCKRFITRPYPQPQDSQLPAFRLTESSPFSFIGVDTCGPLLIKNKKYWVFVVCDLVCRAIDLEIIADMTTAELHLAYRRIVARRRHPVFIVSDNAPQFKLLHAVIAPNTRGAYQWKFIPEFSSWQGGVYERLIGITKQALLRTFDNSILTEIALRTAIAEVVAVLNSRPLTYVSADGQDRPICPNDLLLSSFSLPSDILPPSQATPTADHIVHIWKQTQQSVDTFWSIWRTTYLQYLRSSNPRYNFPKRTTTDPIRPGIVVLISEPKLKRQNWKIGRITSLNLSEDGQVRSANLQLGQRSSGLDFKKPIFISRPLFHLYPLEIPDITESSELEPANVSSEVEEEVIEIDLPDED